MKYIDAHMHIANLPETKRMLENTIYGKKYKIYSSISLNIISKTSEYIDQLSKFYAIPFILKETNIKRANDYVRNFCNENPNAVFVPLIDENKMESFESMAKVFKEHFLIHDYRNWKDRSDYYSFLSEKENYIIIHCKDGIRIEYIQNLRNNFPRMHIIIPHMGRDVYENYSFSRDVIDVFLKDEYVTFDTSTITDVNILKYGIQKLGYDRLSFGSDFPLEFKYVPSLRSLIERFEFLKISDDNMDKLFYMNALARIK